MQQHGVYWITGGLRSGKGLHCVAQIQKFLLEGRRVATNFDLKLENLLPHTIKSSDVLRLPDFPNVDDLQAIGLGYEHDDKDHYDESKFGLLVLDELAMSMNARTWNDKSRKSVIDWLLMSGKKRWILLMVIQDLDLLDKQILRATANQYVVNCRNLSNYSVPILSPIYKFFTGKLLTLPKIHIAVVHLGNSLTSPVVDRWYVVGTNLYDAYRTVQIFLPREHPESIHLSSYLSPYLLKGRFFIKRDFKYFMDLLKDKVHFLFFATVFSSLLSLATLAYSFYEPRKVYLTQNLDNTYLETLVKESNKSSLLVSTSTTNTEVKSVQIDLPKENDCSLFDSNFSESNIVFSHKLLGTYLYHFQTPEGVLNSNDLSIMYDVQVTPISSCLAKLHQDVCSLSITCYKKVSRSNSGLAKSAVGTDSSLSGNEI